jgi:hypothetical protein
VELRVTAGKAVVRKGRRYYIYAVVKAYLPREYIGEVFVIKPLEEPEGPRPMIKDTGAQPIIEGNPIELDRRLPGYLQGNPWVDVIRGRRTN